MSADEVHCMQEMDIPTVTYFYREIQGYGEYTYKLEQVVYNTKKFSYPQIFIEKNHLTNHGLSQLEVFNRLYIPEMNKKALNLAFRCASGVYLCAPSLSGRLEVISILDRDYGKTEEDLWGVLSTSDLACSVYTLVHDYIETRSKNSFFHLGASPFPCGPLFIPLWVSSKTLEEFLLDWKISKIDTAVSESIAVVRCLSGLNTIRKISDSSQKWKPLI